MIETTYKGARILQFELFEGYRGLFHGVFLSDTPAREVEKLLERPCFRAEQIHSDIVCEAPALSPCDGLFTQAKEKPLLIQHADCQAAIFFDPTRQMLALVHAGWRGLVQGIYTKTMLQLKERGVDPKNLLVAIGPSMGPERGEFKGWSEYFPPHFAPFQVRENYFDLKAVARAELLSLGILPSHVEIAKECTVADASRFYSWRRDKTVERHATIAWLEKT